MTQRLWEDKVREEEVQVRGMCLPLVLANSKQHQNVHQWPEIYYVRSIYKTGGDQVTLSLEAPIWYYTSHFI